MAKTQQPIIKMGTPKKSAKDVLNKYYPRELNDTGNTLLINNIVLLIENDVVTEIMTKD